MGLIAGVGDGEDPGFDFAVDVDLFEFLWAGLNELRRDGDGAGAVVGGMDGYQGADLFGVAVSLQRDFEGGVGWRCFDVDAGKGVPGLRFAGLDEVYRVA